MKVNNGPFRNWFGYSRRERRASFVLLGLIFIVLSVRSLVPEKRIPIESIPLNFKEDITETSQVSGSADKIRPATSGSYSYQRKKPLIIDLNRCDTADLIKLPGIGPVLSVRIIRYRQLLGGFAMKEQLAEVYGLPSETYDKIKDMVYADTMLLKRIDINTAEYKQLVRMPYFDRSEINSILKFRELNGSIRNINELVNNKIISEEKAVRVRPYLRFN